MTEFFALIDATPAAYAACFAAILISSATHRVTGQAFGLICAPLIALAAPSHIPALILLCGLPVMVYSFKGDWSDIRWGEISYAFAGRVAGALLVATVIAVVANNQFVSVCVGVAVLIGVAISLTSFAVAINPASLVTAGFLSGAMATLTSVARRRWACSISVKELAAGCHVDNLGNIAQWYASKGGGQMTGSAHATSAERPPTKPSERRDVDALVEENRQLRELVIYLSKLVIRNVTDQK